MVREDREAKSLAGTEETYRHEHIRSCCSRRQQEDTWHNDDQASFPKNCPGELRQSWKMAVLHKLERADLNDLERLELPFRLAAVDEGGTRDEYRLPRES